MITDRGHGYSNKTLDMEMVTFNNDQSPDTERTTTVQPTKSSKASHVSTKPRAFLKQYNVAIINALRGAIVVASMVSLSLGVFYDSDIASKTISVAGGLVGLIGFTISLTPCVKNKLPSNKIAPIVIV